MSKALQVASALTPAVNRVLLAKLKLQVIGEIIDAMDREILETHEFHYDEKWARTGKTGRLDDIKLTYLLAEPEWDQYHDIRADRIEADGWEVPERGYCPKCMADTELRDAHHALIAEAAKFPMFSTISVNALLCAGLKKYEEFIDLCIKLVVNSPGYVAPPMNHETFPLPAPVKRYVAKQVA